MVEKFVIAPKSLLGNTIFQKVEEERPNSTKVKI